MSEVERRGRVVAAGALLTPDEILTRTFPSAFRGLAENEVRSFLRRVADELASLRDREQELLEEVADLAARLRNPPELDETQLLDALGEETAALLRSARAAARDIRAKAEEQSERLLHDAQEQARARREEADAAADARRDAAATDAEALVAAATREADDERAAGMRDASEARDAAAREAAEAIATAKAEGRHLVEEANALRERILVDLGRRRELLQGQNEALSEGRDRLLEAYRTVKRTFLDATRALAAVEARIAAAPGVPAAPAADAADAADAGGASAPGWDVAGAPDAPEGASGREPAEGDGAGPLPVGDGAPAGDGDAGRAQVPPGVGDAELDQVESLFARLRAEQVPPPDGDGDPATDAATAGTLAALADEEAAGSTDDAETPDNAATAAAQEATTDDDERPERDEADAAGTATAAGPDAILVAARDDALAALERPLVRALKRLVQDEQNALLDAVRRHRGRRPDADAVLVDREVAVASWSAVLADPVGRAYAAGAVDDGSAVPPAGLVDDLAARALDALRERVGSAVDEAVEEAGDDDVEAAITRRVGARYREWKAEDAAATAAEVLAAAHAAGVFDTAPEGALLHWIAAAPGACADADDNALEPTPKGEPFPTGQVRPPAHPGCRCLLATAAARLAASDAG